MTTARSRGPVLRGDGRGRGTTGLVGNLVVRRARLVLVAAMLAVMGFGVLGFGAFGKLKTGGFQDPSAESTTAQTLTDRELVLRLVAAGRSNQRIAYDLVVALDTVKKHVTHVLGKFGAANRTEAVARARQLDLIP